MSITLNNRTLLAAVGLFVAVIIFLTYYPSLPGGFVFDDHRAIVTNTTVQQGRIKELWREQGTRFIPYLTFAINAKVSPHPLPFRLINVVLHIINSWLVGYLSLRLWQNLLPHKYIIIGQQRLAMAYVAAIMSMILFAVHPIATQSVSYIVQRLTLLATTSYLVAVLLFLEGRWRRSNTLLLCAFIASLVAMFTKEITFTLPLMIMLADWLIVSPRGEKKFVNLVRRGVFLLPILLIPLTLWLQRGQIIDVVPDPSTEHSPSVVPASTLSPRYYFATQLHVIWTYLRLIILPVSQNFDYDYPLQQTLFTFSTFLAGAGLLTLVMAAVRLRHQYQLLSFGGLWFFLALAVESSVLPIEDVIFEHRIYLPLVGLILASTSILLFPRLKFRPFFAVLGSIVIILSVLTFLRNTTWRSELSLAQDTVAKSPHKARVYHSLGDAYVRSTQYMAAQQAYESALGQDPHYVPALNNLGLLTIDHEPQKAEDFFRRAVAYEPAFAASHANLGVSLARQGKTDEAANAYQQALLLYPKLTTARYNLALLYQRQGKKSEARQLYQEILELDPRHEPSRQALQAL